MHDWVRAQAFRKNMAAAAYALTSSYDSAVSAWMAGEAARLRNFRDERSKDVT